MCTQDLKTIRYIILIGKGRVRFVYTLSFLDVTCRIRLGTLLLLYKFVIIVVQICSCTIEINLLYHLLNFGSFILRLANRLSYLYLSFTEFHLEIDGLHMSQFFERKKKLNLLVNF